MYMTTCVFFTHKHAHRYVPRAVSSKVETFTITSLRRVPLDNMTYIKANGSLSLTS